MGINPERAHLCPSGADLRSFGDLSGAAPAVEGKGIMSYVKTEFAMAKPVWEPGRENERNRSLIVSAVLDGADEAELRLSGSSVYRVFVNRRLVWWGPARSGKGFFRVDEIPLGGFLHEGENTVAVEVTGYCCSSFEWMKHSSFLCAELTRGGAVLAATGAYGWQVFRDGRRLQKTPRFSFQRPFSEAYDHRAGRVEPTGWAVVPGGEWIERDLPEPSLAGEPVRCVVQTGELVWRADAPQCQNAFLVRAGKKFDGFPVEELEVNQVGDALRYSRENLRRSGASLPLTLPGNTFATLKLAGNRTGLLRVCVQCMSDCDLYLCFDELLTDGRVDFLRLDCANVVLYRLRGGERYELLTAEPYTLQYLDLLAVGGAVRVEEAGVVRIDFPPSQILLRPRFSPEDEAIGRIWNAAVETFRQNTLDVLMDCPSRERAGWLCDSFFTGRVEHLLTGRNRVERNFLSNFIMAKDFSPLPDGMIPMCYPADHPDGTYIPNWAMWLILELKEYLDRTGDAQLIREAKARVYGIMEFLRRFENPDGLLERLKGWVFVEWSRSNELVQDINYPTNMLYCLAKSTAAALYGDGRLAREAAQLRETIRRQSRMGLFFCDNALLRDGAPVLSGECTESAQYYAFFSGVATRQEDAELWETLVRDFGPERKQTGLWKEIWPSNAFIGNYLRLELLDRAGEYGRLRENILGYFGYMAQQTGTLWENDTPTASCNHGFASHVLVWLAHLGYGQE